MRYQWIDSLKGLGMILVIATHTSLPTIFPKLLLLLTSGYMAMFFIISGYTAKKEPFVQAVKKKSNRLLVPYFFYGVVITSMFTIVKGNLDVNKWIGLLYSRYAIFPLYHLNNTFLLSGETAPLWFLTAMFVSYILFYIYVNLKGTINKYGCVILYIISTIFLKKIDILLPWSIDTSFLCALFIIIGYEFSTYAKREYKKELTYFAALFILLGVYISIVVFNGKTNLSVGVYGNFGVMSTFLYFVCSFIITFLYGEMLKSCGNNFIVKFLAFVGTHSLRLMCIHLPIIVLMGMLFNRFGVIGQFAVFISTFTLSLVLSVLIEKICRRYMSQCHMLKYL